MFNPLALAAFKYAASRPYICRNCCPNSCAKSACCRLPAPN